MASFFTRREGAAKAGQETAARPTAHFYLDTRARLLHCLNDTARQWVRDGVPLNAADLRATPLYHPDGQPVAASELPLHRAWRERAACEATFVLARPGVPPRYLHWCASPLVDRDGQVCGVLGSLWTAAPEPDWQALAGLAHDLRSPLQTIRLLAPVLHALAGLPEAARDTLRRAQHAAERAVSIGMDLLEWCRAPLESGRPVQARWFPLAPFLVGLADEQVPAAERKKIRLETDLGPAYGLEICCDAVRLGRLLANLLTNAVRYTETGGVRLAAAWRDEAGQRRALALQVLDTGAGLAADDPDSIFQPFERGKAGRGSDPGGSGVGLSVVDRLVDELGLTLEVYSEYGRGSSFELLLPPDILRTRSSGDTVKD